MAYRLESRPNLPELTAPLPALSHNPCRSYHADLIRTGVLSNLAGVLGHPRCEDHPFVDNKPFVLSVGVKCDLSYGRLRDVLNFAEKQTSRCLFPISMVPGGPEEKNNSTYSPGFGEGKVIV